MNRIFQIRPVSLTGNDCRLSFKYNIWHFGLNYFSRSFFLEFYISTHGFRKLKESYCWEKNI